jgi:hypothetical protein
VAKKAKASRSAKKAAKSISRAARATKKAVKVAAALAKGAQHLARPKQSIEVTVTTKALGEAPQQYHFILSDGRHLKSLYELVDELETMGDDAYRQYVNEGKNDFANWISDVFDERHLAEDIRRTQQRIDTQRAILKHLVRELRKMVYSQKRK